MSNGYYAPFYRGPYFNTNPQAAQQMQTAQAVDGQFGGMNGGMPYQMPQMPQTQMPQVPTPPAVPSSDMIWVLNENEASSYLVAPGNTVTLWDKNEPVIYLKSVDAQGMPSMRVLEFTERLPEPRRSSQTGVDTGEGKYASAEAFASLRGEVESLREKLEALSMKPASKTRKTEESDNG